MMNTYDIDNANCSDMSAQQLFNKFNHTIFGLAVSAVGLYVRVYSAEFDELIGSLLIPAATYICVAAGGVVALMSLLGCAGILLENRKLLIVYAAFLVVVLIVEVTVGILGFLNRGKVESSLDDSLKSAILEKYGYQGNQLVTTAINIIQYKMACCGYTGPYDWDDSRFYNDNSSEVVTRRGSSIIPVTCCRDVTVFGCYNAHNDTTRFTVGCKDKVKDILMDNLKILGVTTVAISTVQLLGLGLAVYLYNKSNDDVEDFCE